MDAFDICCFVLRWPLNCRKEGDFAYLGRTCCMKTTYNRCKRIHRSYFIHHLVAKYCIYVSDDDVPVPCYFIEPSPRHDSMCLSTKHSLSCERRHVLHLLHQINSTNQLSVHIELRVGLPVGIPTVGPTVIITNRTQLARTAHSWAK